MREKKIYQSKCCFADYISKSNGLWTYYICKKCGGKTEVRKPDMRLKINKTSK